MKETPEVNNCYYCKRQMEDGVSCEFDELIIDGEKLKRVAFGGEEDYSETIYADTTKFDCCMICRTGVGGYHHLGCDEEECPSCGPGVYFIESKWYSERTVCECAAKIEEAINSAG